MPNVVSNGTTTKRDNTPVLADACALNYHLVCIWTSTWAECWCKHCGTVEVPLRPLRRSRWTFGAEGLFQLNLIRLLMLGFQLLCLLDQVDRIVSHFLIRVSNIKGDVSQLYRMNVTIRNSFILDWWRRQGNSAVYRFSSFSLCKNPELFEIARRRRPGQDAQLTRLWMWCRLLWK